MADNEYDEIVRAINRVADNLSSLSALCSLAFMGILAYMAYALLSPMFGWGT